MDKKWDLIIIGGGPGGYVSAIRGAQLKKKVLLVEEHKIGGTCMNYGCIPAKYLLHQTKIYKDLKENRNLEGPLEAIKCDWKRVQKERSRVVERLVKGLEFLIRKSGVEMTKGQGSMNENGQVSVRVAEGEEKVVEAEKVILATGSRPAELPFIQPNGKEIITSQEALELDEIPRKLLVIGAGAIGLEMGTIYQRLGSEVTILEILPTILPGSDIETAKRLERILKEQGLNIHTRLRIESSQVNEGKVVVKGLQMESQSPFEFQADKALLAVGRNPNSEGLSAQDSPLSLDEKGSVIANSLLETSLPGVYAIGDLIGGKLLAHKASHEGLIAAENAFGKKTEMNYAALPLAVFTDPEFSSVGLTEEEATEKGIKIQKGVLSLQASGRALTLGRQEGMVKILADERDRVIGAHMLAPNASEFIPEITLAMSKGLRIQDISSSIHIHPTLSEAVMEATMKTKNEAIHVLND
jgi:dihydrolipoamide dehydrogenase